MREIILASNSPRRKEIFAKTNLPFVTEDSGYEEDMSLAMPPIELAKYLSLGKAKASGERHPDAIVIAADTFVVFEGKLLGKPKSEDHAREMLRMLSGKENDVITGVAILDTKTGKTVSFHDTSKIFMKEMSEETIDAYIKTGDPMDKAGAYAVQEIGAVLIEKIEGDFFNVMGLPISRLADHLKDFDVSIL
ncbi:MAG: Maf family protein [Candidatus Paceibacterota bacterium]|jgi:septum formation protein